MLHAFLDFRRSFSCGRFGSTPWEGVRRPHGRLGSCFSAGRCCPCGGEALPCRGRRRRAHTFSDEKPKHEADVEDGRSGSARLKWIPSGGER
eukprot:scaffold86_cov338-Pavlova_lutheri.AAC.25